MNRLLRGTRTKIIATMGPSIQNNETLKQLIEGGVDLFRLNFSHGTFEEHQKNYDLIREASEALNYPAAILQDLQGPKIRLDCFKDVVVLKKGDQFFLSKERIDGDKTKGSLSYPEILDQLEYDEKILINDGLVILQVKEKRQDGILTDVVVGGEISSHKGVNFPTSSLSGIPALTEKDLQDLEYGLKLGVDYVAISFVRHASDIDLLKWEIDKHCFKKVQKPRIIAKIEKSQAIDEIDQILDKVDGIMVARGDLGVELDITKVPNIQRELINKANLKGKLVITATQMLDSMTHNFTPTRAEVTDVANAVLDGTDAVMLSGETAVGKYPLRVVDVMNNILKNTENEIFSKPQVFRSKLLHEACPSIAGAISESVSIISQRLPIKAIVCFTFSGYTPLILSKSRPYAPIIAYCNDKVTQKKVSLMWGTIGKVMDKISAFDNLIKEVEKDLMQNEYLKRGDTIIIVTGLPTGVIGSTNTIKIHKLP